MTASRSNAKISLACSRMCQRTLLFAHGIVTHSRSLKTRSRNNAAVDLYVSLPAEAEGDDSMDTTATQISSYRKTLFEAGTSDGHLISHDVYRRGAGAPVVLLQELPGIGQETLSLADELVNAGFEVVMPHLFGPLGETAIGGNLVRVMCLRKEFWLMRSDRSSPIADWIRLLCREVRNQRGVNGVGIITCV